MTRRHRPQSVDAPAVVERTRPDAEQLYILLVLQRRELRRLALPAGERRQVAQADPGVVDQRRYLGRAPVAPDQTIGPEQVVHGRGVGGDLPGAVFLRESIAGIRGVRVPDVAKVALMELAPRRIHVVVRRPGEVAARVRGLGDSAVPQEIVRRAPGA